MNSVRSKDGTPIAYERMGSGPAVILVDGALCSRVFGPMSKLAPLLAKHFTVFVYDRRGRGESGDTQPYAKERELEDIAALISEAGGAACLYGASSGGALAIEAAAGGLNVDKVAAYEPPYVNASGAHRGTDHEARLREMIASGRRGDAVKFFMRDMVGIPAVFYFMMRLMRGMWRKLEAVAHTLPYDAAIMGDYSLPEATLAAVKAPVLIMHGGKTTPLLRDAAEDASALLPNGQLRVLAGQTHNAPAEVLAPVLAEFFAG